MHTLIICGLAGLLGQLVSGTLGMGFGVTSTTALVALGTAPALASAMTHIATVGISVASGIAHWRFRNIDWRTVAILAAPGAAGAGVGAYVLTTVSADLSTVWIAAVLFLMGTYVLLRFAFFALRKAVGKQPLRVRFLAPLGLIAGFVDATGGGGWGPIGTTTLLSSGRLEPRKVVGSVAASELTVTVAASIGFLWALPLNELDSRVMLGLLIGGVVAAPLAAWLVRKLPSRILGTAAGGLIVITNARTLLTTVGAGPAVAVAVYVVLVAVWAVGMVVAVRAVREQRRLDAATAEPGGEATHAASPADT